jgi:hypothetical protein
MEALKSPEGAMRRRCLGRALLIVLVFHTV